MLRLSLFFVKMFLMWLETWFWINRYSAGPNFTKTNKKQVVYPIFILHYLTLLSSKAVLTAFTRLRLARVIRYLSSFLCHQISSYCFVFLLTDGFLGKNLLQCIKFTLTPVFSGHCSRDGRIHRCGYFQRSRWCFHTRSCSLCAFGSFPSEKFPLNGRKFGH